ncbi:hypothetical protein EC988_004727 [Linderina pennispora]|nr:hypothetical protein EC988_004727 [Linderina pennispora]
MIRQRLKSGSVHPAQSRRHTDTRTTVTEDEVDEAVLQIQVTNPLVTWFLQCKDTSALSRLLHQTSADMAQAVFRSKGQNEWISTDSSDPVMGSTFFTSSQLSMASNFITSEVRSALRAAVIRTGADLTDSWIRALATIPKVTLAVAQCIVAQYPTPRCLFDAWERQGSVPERAQMLANLTVSSGRRLGITMSTRIFHMFTESNPSKPYAEC